nr:beta-glucosidase BoGH3B-like isoform X3 [Ziziphus jujuba var. spinosa]
MCGWVSDEFSNSNYICNRLQELCAFVVLQLQVKIMGEKVVDMKNCLYKNSKEPIEARVKDLLSRMTLEEKVGQMTQIERRVATSHAIKNLGIGSILSACGNGPQFEKPLSNDWADMVDMFQKWALDSRLGIPLVYAIDAVHGNGSVYGATIFPHNIGLGATRCYRDPDLAQRIGRATAIEVRASGIHWNFGPCVSVCKDPRWGRCYESYNENTEIVRKMTSTVTGLQGQPPEGHPQGYPFLEGRDNIISCAKHFVGDGGTKEGVNEGNTEIEESELKRIHMLPFIDCISKGVSIIMASYSSWKGDKLHAHRYLLTEILKDNLGFKGLLVSDWKAIERLSDARGQNYRKCIELAINAGIDMVMVPYNYEEFIKHLLSLVKCGEIPMSRIDDAVERILRVKFAARLFDFPFSNRKLLDEVGCKRHRELAREAVRKSLVLLKNGKNPNKPTFLPLDKKAKRILIAGSHADNLGFQCGGWTSKWQGRSGRITQGTTILDAIKEAVGKETEVIYEESPSIGTLSRQDISYAVVAVGEEPYAESFGDNKELLIPFNGTEIINLVAERIPTLVIIISGRPLVLEAWLLDKIDGLVAAWLPGTEGGGIADLIFGDHDFHGKLPMTWFKRVSQLPMDVANGKSYDPLFPLGFGLTLCNRLANGIDVTMQ